MSCEGLATFTTRVPGPASCPARAIAASVPSIASTATTARSLHDDGLADVETGDRVGDRDSRTRSRRASPSSGAVAVSTPGLASRSASSAVESISVMPCSSSTPATAAISASVLPAGRRRRAASSVGSGTTPPNSLTCLTWPAMTARLTPAPSSVAMHAPSCAELHPGERRAAELARERLELGKRLALDGDDGHVVPELTGGAKHEKRERAVAGDQADRHGAGRVAATRLHQVVDPLRRATQDDAAARRRDEVDEIAHLRRRQRRIALDQLERAAGVVLDEVPVGAAQLADELGAEAAARQADRVDAVDARAVADGLRERQRVAGDDRVAADERVLPDAAELVHARIGADRREVLDGDVAAERRGVAEDRVVADVAVVRDVRVGHEQVVVADRRDAAAARRAAMDGDELAEDVAAADDEAASARRGTSGPAARGRSTRTDRSRVSSPISVQPSTTLDAPILQCRPMTTFGPDRRVRSDHRSRSDPRRRMDDGGVVDDDVTTRVALFPERELATGLDGDQQLRFGDDIAGHGRHRRDPHQHAAPAAERDLELQAIARHDLAPELRVVDAAQPAHSPPITAAGEQEQRRHLRRATRSSARPASAACPESGPGRTPR